MSSKPHYMPPSNVPLPPTDAEVFTTACDYCIVACGYKVYRWPVGKDGSEAAGGNAFNMDYPTQTMTGAWVSPNQHNIVTHNGKPHNVAIVGDRDTKVVNVGGDHSIRGGTIAKKCYNPNSLTKDRLLYPQVRVDGKLQRISWDDAIEVMAEVSKHVIKTRTKSAWGMKMFSYNFWENTHALTKLAFRGVDTPVWAVHDQPTGHGPDTPGMSDAGIDNFSASYEDWSTADVLFMVGTDPFEAKTIIFNQWILNGIRNGMKVISVVPRRTQGVAHAEQNNGMYMEINPGTDNLLLNAMARIIVENGWEDKEFVSKWINNKAERDKEVFQADGFDDFKEWILNYKYARLDIAAEKTGIPAEQILEAAATIAKPRADGKRSKTSFAMEKGLYWSNNYGNTAALTALGLICGAGNRPGQVISRFGGHQRGMMPGGRYPEQESPEKFPGWRKQGIDVDRWVEQGRVGFMWVIGTTWIQAMTASRRLEERIRTMSSAHSDQPTSIDKQHLIDTYKRRSDNGGFMLVHQDVYPVEPINTEIADLVLPASGWGEQDLTRANGERRIRLYSKFNDAPGESLADWDIAARFARAMGYSGFDWKDSNEVFEDAAFYNKGRRTSYVALVEYARLHGRRAHEVLRDYGTTGIQGPVRWEDGKLVGTQRLHDSTLKTGTASGLTKIDPNWLRKFKTKTGRANLLKAVWETFGDYWEFMKPQGDELWVTSGRVNEIWQSGYDDQIRREYLQQRWPDNWLEIHPDDAKARGIVNGDMLEISHDRIPVEVGGYGDSEADRKLRGMTPLKANADIDEVDELAKVVDSDHTESRAYTPTSMGNDDITEPDEMLSSFGPSKPSAADVKRKKERDELHDKLDLDDPLMKSLESGLGLKWDEVKPMTFTEMMKNNQIEMDSASFKAVALVTDNVKKGVTFTYFNTTTKDRTANALAGRVNDPISQRPRYKLARGVVKKIGESDYKYDFSKMSFKSRAI
ncbi:MAG: arsenite oxidase large subunit [Alteromonadaceae bacterium]|jgi:arsenite oxidase large subunit